MSSYGYASWLPLTCSSMFGPAFFLNDDQESVTEFLRIRSGTGSDDCGRNIRARSEYSETRARARVYSPFVKRWISIPRFKGKVSGAPVSLPTIFRCLGSNIEVEMDYEREERSVESACSSLFSRSRHLASS